MAKLPKFLRAKKDGASTPKGEEAGRLMEHEEPLMEHYAPKAKKKLQPSGSPIAPAKEKKTKPSGGADMVAP